MNFLPQAWVLAMKSFDGLKWQFNEIFEDLLKYFYLSTMIRVMLVWQMLIGPSPLFVDDEVITEIVGELHK